MFVPPLTFWIAATNFFHMFSLISGILGTLKVLKPLSKGPIDVHSEDRRELLGTDWKLCIHLGRWKLQDKDLESKQLGMEVEETVWRVLSQFVQRVCLSICWLEKQYDQ